MHAASDLANPREPLLNPEKKRLAMFPIQCDETWRRYRQALACFWVAGEVDLSNDLVHWNTRLNDDERHFISHVLAFFASSDLIVNENLAERFGREVSLLEVKCFYDFQKSMENIHSEMYSTLIDTYISQEKERRRMLDAVDTIPCVQAKARWAHKWIESQESFAARLIAFAVVEGIFFSGSFCAIFWLKKRGLMPGLCHSNELISRDEGLHQEFATYLYREKVQNKLDVQTVYDIVKDAVEQEILFCTEALPVKLISMNSEDMCEYIKYVADRLLMQLGVPKLYHASNPFDWMELISLEGKTNFFERRVGEYQKSGVTNSSGAHCFATDDEF
jgi:ribonucleoside-diphosphate reductase beta chain